MQEFLSGMIGRRLDIYCTGAASLRGEILKVDGGVLHIRDDDGQLSYVAIDKIVAVWEVREDEPRPGFISAKTTGFTTGSRKSATKTRAD